MPVEAEETEAGAPVATPGPRSRLAGGPPPGWAVRGREIDLSRPLVMGILNLTPDSFSDGGELQDVHGALGRARAMVEAGAGMLDVGGESTRPGAAPVPTELELARVVPVVEALVASFDVPVSVDTRKSEVAHASLAAGAHVVNDVSGLAHDPDMAGVVASSDAGLVLMHMRGDPTTMRDHASYRDVTGEVVDELGMALGKALGAGIPGARVVVDPGLGFAKTGEHTRTLLRELRRLRALGRPVLVGPSRKSFLGEILDVPPEERVAGTVAACILAWLEGARIFRVHDVAPVVQALEVARAVRAPETERSDR